MSSATQKKYELDRQSDLREAVARIIAEVDKLTLDLVLKIDSREQGHPFGVEKFKHMKDLEQHSYELSRQFKLGPEESLLFTLVGRTHDIGRHIETLNKLDKLRQDRRHGFLSADFLRQHNLLHTLTQEHQQAVLDAVTYHAELEVPLAPESLGNRLCYLLRDLDKLETFQAPKYTQPEGIFEQLYLWYLPEIFPNSEELKSARTWFKAPVIEELELFLSHSSLPSISDDREGEVRAFVRRIMNGGISDDKIETFCEQSSMRMDSLRQSWSAYRLQSLAMIFDVKDNYILEEILSSRCLVPYFEQFSRTLDSHQITRISSALDSYLTQRLKRPSKVGS